MRLSYSVEVPGLVCKHIVRVLVRASARHRRHVDAEPADNGHKVFDGSIVNAVPVNDFKSVRVAICSEVGVYATNGKRVGPPSVTSLDVECSPGTSITLGACGRLAGTVQSVHVNNSVAPMREPT